MQHEVTHRWARRWYLISSCLHQGECKCHCKGKWLPSIPLSLSFSISLYVLRAVSAPLSAFTGSHFPQWAAPPDAQISHRLAEEEQSEGKVRNCETGKRNGKKRKKKLAILMKSIWPSTPCLTRPRLPSPARPLELWSRLQFVNVTNDLYPFLFPSFSPSFFSPALVCPHSGLGPSNHFQSADSHLKSAAVIK